MSLNLGVNVDHVATVREARGTNYPSPLEAARASLDAGAHSITVHLREDRRHIQDHDLHAIHQEALPMNLEMANAEEIIGIALALKPDEVCLVPEKREEVTTEGGLDVTGHREALRETVARLGDAGIVVSLFVDPEPAQLEASAEIGAPCIELHTGAFCLAEGPAAEGLLEELVRGAELAHAAGLQVNAGHGIHLGNIGDILRIPHLDTLNIGHSLVARAIMVGMGGAVQEMLEAMKPYAHGTR